MDTEILLPNDESFNRAIAALQKGEIIAFPTDTVYGIGGHAFKANAVEMLYHIKARSREKPIALLLSKKEDIPQMALEVSEVAWRLAERFLPGGLTLVLTGSPELPPWVFGLESTIALRVPDNPIALRLIETLGAPLATTSANISGQRSPITPEEVYEQLKGRIPFIIDGGTCPKAMESTVVDARGEWPVILRQGVIAAKDLEALCGKVLI